MPRLGFLLVVVLGGACSNDPAPAASTAPPPTSPAAGSAAPSRTVGRADPRPAASAGIAVTDEPEAPAPTVILVVLRSFPDPLVDAIEHKLEEELHIDVTRHGVLDLPAQAYYRPRRRYRADKLLDTLATIAPDAPPTTKVLGLTEVDISTTNEDIRDWGIFGLGSLDGRSAVMSSFRLRRRARGPEHLAFRIATTALHEVGHTFGLPHCEEDRCAMLDAEGGIENTDTSTGHFGPGCQAAFARSVERPAP